MVRRRFVPSVLGVGLLFAVGCNGDDSDLDSEEDARRAYLGLDGSIEKGLDLGMDGFNAASNANIPSQTGDGDANGTITIDGKVDQGSSDNKGLRLTVLLEAYSDGVIETVDDEDIEIVYDTDGTLPALDLTLRDIPNGTLEGTLVGTYHMSGSIEGTATLDLSFSGMLEDDGSGGISRAPGSIQVTGIARSGDAIYDVDVAL